MPKSGAVRSAVIADADISPPTVLFTQTLAQPHERGGEHQDQDQQRQMEEEEERGKGRREWDISMKSTSALGSMHPRGIITSTRSSNLFCKGSSSDRHVLEAMDTCPGELHPMKEEERRNEIQTCNEANLKQSSHLYDHSLQKQHEGQRRYKPLLPLNWGEGNEEVGMLARDSITHNLVITRLYRYCHHSASTVAVNTGATNRNSAFACSEENEPTDTLFVSREEGRWMDESLIPFSASWKQRMYDLRNIRHANITPVLDVVINEERRELLMVYPYMDSMQPLAVIMQHHTYLTSHELTPLLFSRIVCEVIAGVIFLHHRGLMHGAISPWTVLLNEEGRAQITGFAISHKNHFQEQHQEQQQQQEQKREPDYYYYYFYYRLHVDVFAVGVLVLTMMAAQRVSHSTHMKPVGRAVCSLLNRDPMRRMRLEELAEVMKSVASAAAAPSRGLPPTDSRKSNEELPTSKSQSRSTRDAVPSVLSVPAMTTAEAAGTTTRASNPSVASPPLTPVIGILQPTSSPLLYRSIELDRHRGARAAGSTQSSRNPSTTSGRLPRQGGRRFLSKWRVAAFVVFLCVTLGRMGAARRGRLPVRFLTKSGERHVEWRIHGGGRTPGFASSISKPRRPISIGRRRLFRRRSAVSM